MKREIILALLLALCLTGCAQSDDPYRVDTVVYIPVDPTEPPETAVETAAETEAVTESATETEEEVPETTEPAKKQTGSNKTSSNKTSSNKTSSNKTSSNKNSSSKTDSKSKETEPPETKPAQTEPAQPPVTVVPTTEAPEAGGVTEPAVSETAPAETEPVETEPELYDISGYSVGSLERAIADQINEYRAQQGVAELAFSSRLSAIASARGYEAAAYWSHTRPDGRSYATVLSDYGYGAGTVHEILTHGSSDAAAVVATWMATESQKNNLLSTSYSTIGVGVYSGGGTTIIVCMLVG